MAAAINVAKMRAADFVPFHTMKMDDEDKFNLAFAYLGNQEWRKALAIFETYSNRPVSMPPGPWGQNFTLIFTSKEAAFCQNNSGCRRRRIPSSLIWASRCCPLHSFDVRGR